MTDAEMLRLTSLARTLNSTLDRAKQDIAAGLSLPGLPEWVAGGEVLVQKISESLGIASAPPVKAPVIPAPVPVAPKPGVCSICGEKTESGTVCRWCLPRKGNAIIFRTDATGKGSVERA